MVKIRLAYGKDGLTIDLCDDWNVDVVEPVYVQGLADPAGAVRDALRSPIGAEPLRRLVSESDTVAIVVNDITRPTPYPILLPALLDELAVVPDEHIVLFCATGTHRPNTEAELRSMLTDAVFDRFRIVQNDAHDKSSHRLVGTTNGGNEIRIHREYLECDVKILTGFIEPHFFAGFSGGPKAVMPGLASLETILRNHSPARIDHAKATWGSTEDNPIWREIREGALMTGPTFLVNVALNRDQQITRVFAGDLCRAHEQGCAFVRDRAMVPLREPYDVVLTSNCGYPLDQSLYQCVKGLSAAAQIVKPGGAIIAAAQCCDGIPDHGKFRDLLFGAPSPDALLETVCAEGLVQQDAWQAQIHAQICRKAQVYFYSENLTDEQIERSLLRPCRDIVATIRSLLDEFGAGASICVLPEGPQTIPYIVGDRDDV